MSLYLPKLNCAVNLHKFTMRLKHNQGTHSIECSLRVDCREYCTWNYNSLDLSDVVQEELIILKISDKSFEYLSNGECLCGLNYPLFIVTA